MKKLNTFIVALSLIFGMAQCKKQETPATELVDRCYASMFYQCGTIEQVTCLATTITGSGCTTDWLNGVKPYGTFTKAKGASCWTTGSNGIPWGWTVNEY